MTPTSVVGAPLHPLARIAMPVAALALGGAAAYTGLRVTDTDRSGVDRMLSGVVGAGTLAGVTALGFKLGAPGVVGDALVVGALGGGLVGGIGGIAAGTLIDGHQHGKTMLDYLAGPEGQRTSE